MAAPLGNQNAKKGKISTEALRMELAQDRAALRKMWKKQIEKAKEGDLQAFTAINDRLEGKPPQAIIGDEENPIKFVQRVERVIVNAKDKDG